MCSAARSGCRRCSPHRRRPSRSSSGSAPPIKALAFVLLGLNFIFNGMIWLSAVAVFTARTATRVRRSGRAMRWINRALGGMFVLFGVRLAALQAR
ncbi:LysE family transporter [Bradyrhizobium sp.]|uniref:LysE family transporter n=1 Tax=Bradyrhizobium sp. TaxID=376 RepID=UPI00345D276C